MTSEEHLRQLLRDEAERIVPAGDGLAVVRARVARRRSRVRFWVPVTALAAVVAVAAGGAVLAGAVRPSSTAPAPAASSVPSGDPRGGCAASDAFELCEAQSTAPPLPGTTPRTSAAGTPLWPFTREPEGPYPDSAADPVRTAQQFVDQFLRLRGATATEPVTDRGATRVRLLRAGVEVGAVRLVRIGAAEGPFTVTGVTATGLALQDPADGAEVRSPLDVQGEVRGYDQSVRLRLVVSDDQGAPRQLDEQFVPAGQDQPWKAVLRWSEADWPVGAVVASLLDGQGALQSVSVTAVRRDGAADGVAPVAGATFLAVVDGAVELRDARDGALLRTLSYPSGGAVDGQPVRGGRDLVAWVRSRPDCSTEVVRIGLAGGGAGVTAVRGPVLRRALALSPDGRTVAWVESPCAAPQGGELVVRGPDGVEQRTPLPAGARADDQLALDLADDGATVLSYATTAGPGAVTVAAAPSYALRAAGGCSLGQAVFLGAGVAAWERCATGSRLVTFAAGAVGGTAGPLLPGVEVRRSSEAGGVLLVQLADQRVARYARGGLQVVRDDGPCTTGCVGEAAW